MTKVGIFLIRDAETDPPDHENYVWTDIGESTYWGKCWLQNDEGETPKVWYDLKMPNDDAPTLTDLSRLIQVAKIGVGSLWFPALWPDHRQFYDDDISAIDRISRMFEKAEPKERDNGRE